MCRFFSTLLFLLSISTLLAQEELDNLLVELERKDLPDTSRVNLLHDISEIYRYSDAEKSASYGFQCMKLAEKIGYPSGQLSAYNNLGSFYLATAKYDSSLLYLNKALKILDETALSPLVTYNSMGNLYFYQSEYEQSLDWYLKTLDAAKIEQDSSAMARSYGNIGNIYYYLQDMPKVKQNFLRSLEIKEALKDSAGIAHTMGNMGNLYADVGDYDSSIYYFSTSLEIFRRENNLFGMSLCLASLSDSYRSLNQFEKAESSLKESIEYGELIGDQHGLMRSYHQLASILHARGKYAEAVETYQTGIQLAKEINSKEFIKDGYLKLSGIQEENGKYKDALINYKQYHAWNDSIFSEKKNEAIANLLTQYRTKEVEDSLRISQQNEELAEIKTQEAEAASARKSKQLWAAIGGLVILTALVILVLQFYRQKKKANIELEEKNVEISKQRDIIHEKHAEITDSIAYAKRIQAAILPPMRIVKEYLKNSFVLYKPKDVVAGDFYWMETKGSKILFAAADCTGHGVPGAMVSVICNNALNRAVREHNITEAGKILDKAREIVIQEFEKSEEEVKDGMDIALCVLDGNTLQFAGAHNPLWIIRKDAKEIEEIKANKQPIGKFHHPEPYETHTITLHSGDSFYLFSDGYADQFGGEKGKKFKSKTFKDLLLSIQQQDMDEQRNAIDKAFENWRGDFEQVDDVCVIGVRV